VTRCFPARGSGRPRRIDGLQDAAAQAAALGEVGHRPWPLPEGPWLLGQTWVDLLFAHWPVPPELLRSHVPAALELEQFDGSAWLGVTPFLLRGLRLRGTPPLPLVSRFYEVNCRTYVRVGDRPGIWFFSLDASSRMAVGAARRAYRLPYRHARISRDGLFVSRRNGESPALVQARYSVSGPAFTAEPGTLEHFLTERYCLYADGGRARADIHHRPWRLHEADADVLAHRLAPVPVQGEPICHYAGRQDVLVWPLEQLPA
jgi:uncharacterized protein